MKNPSWKMLLLVFALILFRFTGQALAQETDEKRAFVYANRLMSDKMYDLAADQFLDYVQKYPGSPRAAEAQFLAAQCLMNEGNYHKAIQAFRTLILRYSQFQRLDEAQLGIADSYKKLQLYKKAAESYENLPLYYPQSPLAPKALMLAADVYQKIGNPEKSHELWVRVIKEYPKSELKDRARLKVAMYFYQKGDFPTALRYLVPLTESKNPNVMAEALLRKGEVLEALGRVADAQDVYQKAASSNEFQANWRAKAMVQLGLLNEKMGNWGDALTEFQMVLKIAPAGKYALQAKLHLAKAFLVRGNPADALQNYKQVAETSRDSSLKIQALLGAGVASEKMLDFEGAIRFLETITDMKNLSKREKSQERTAYLHLLNDFLRLDKTTSARETIIDFLKRFKNDPYCEFMEYRLASLDELKRNVPGKALAEYKNFLQTFPRSPFADDAVFGEARCLEKLGQNAQALSIYQQFGKRFPGSDRLPEVEKRLEWYQNFENTDLQESAKQLSNIMGIVLLGQGKENALYALFKLDYNQLKDYKNVVTLGHLILKTNSAPDYSQEILFYMGRGYQLLAQRYSSDSKASAYRDSSISIYRRFLTQYSTHPKAPEAKFQLIQLAAKGLTPLQLHQRYLDLVMAYPLSTNRPEIYFYLGKTLVDSAMAVPSDSLSNAKTYFQKTIKLNPKSPWADQAMFYLADLEQKHQNKTAAITRYKAYIQQFPQGRYIASATYQLAKLTAGQRQFKKALGLFETVQREFYYTDYSDSALSEMADLYVDLKNYDRALRVLDEVEKIHPNATGNLLFKRGFILYRQGKTNEALRKLRRYIVENPAGRHVAESLKIMADISTQSGDTKQALEIYRQVLSTAQNNETRRKARLKIATILFDAGNYKQALNQYNLLLAQNPSDIDLPDVQAKKILCLIHLGKIELAKKQLKLFKKSYKGIDSYLGQIYFEFGNYYVSQKNFDRGVQNYKLLTGKFKRTKWRPYGEYGLGRVYLVMNKTEKALKILTVIPKKYPHSKVLPLVYLNLGDFYYKSKQFDNAMAAFKKVLAANPSAEVKKTAMKYLIKVYSDLGMWDSALRASRQYIQAFPNGPDVFDQKIQMGIYYVRLEEYDQAIRYFRKLLPEADSETEAEIQYWIGESYFKMGQFERAISEFLKVRYLSKPTKLPWDVTAEYEAGLAYLKLNKPQKAKAIFQKIVKERGAGSDYGKVAMKRIREIDQGGRK